MADEQKDQGQQGAQAGHEPPAGQAPPAGQEPLLKEPVSVKDGTPLKQKSTDEANLQCYLAEFWSGTGSAKILLQCMSDHSAAMAALLIARKWAPETSQDPGVHTFGVWKATDKTCEKLTDTVCFVAMTDTIRSVAPILNKLTGKNIAVPGAMKIVTPEAGIDELGGQLRNRQGGRLQT